MVLERNASAGSHGGFWGCQPSARENGVVLLAVLMLLAVVTVVSAASITTMLMDLRMSGYYSKRVLVFYIAEAGVNRARYEVSNGDGNRDFSSIAEPTVLFQNEALNGGSYTVVATPFGGCRTTQSDSIVHRVLSGGGPLPPDTRHVSAGNIARVQSGGYGAGRTGSVHRLERNLLRSV